MEPKLLDKSLTVSGQITIADLPQLAARGVKTLICNRPNGEGSDQPGFQEIAQAAEALGMTCHYLPVISGEVRDEDAAQFGKLLDAAQGPVHAYCRSGMRSTVLWALYEGRRRPVAEIARTAKQAGYDMSGIAARINSRSDVCGSENLASYDVVIVGGGAAGIATAASLRKRNDKLSIAIIDPADVHYYQPGWTLVGAGIFQPQQTARTMASLIPRGVAWIKAAVAAFDPQRDTVVLEGCRLIGYKRLVVAPGIKLHWEGVEGLLDTLGANGVTSNYRFDLAPYTWQLVQNLRKGRALFTQPPMPIKCAGAPQKAMYLSADYWTRQQRLADIDIEFCNAGAVLFGVQDYVPALMQYVKKYAIQLSLGHKLVKVDGPGHRAWFETAGENDTVETVEREFDMIHVVPPQVAPDFIRASPLVNATGWVDVEQNTLRHNQYTNIWSLGDVTSAPNAKTAAAARKQAPVVANNILADMGLGPGVAHYDGYGACPLTVERGRVVMAEFGYGGKLLPTFPRWLVDGTRATRLAWLLKEKVMPPLYWQGMLRGHEWLARPEVQPAIGEG
ncbi:MAG TPA: TIGR01244 family sulfur transferase [Spongiibacteraceae bacterium]|jgi:sulfide:quinone oxidoreductase|nr:TIGR01244 family sulfur transferase [Spongiibacteraceae bacterium]HUH36878.1 TIGR01244 family sulfur transferase [Spongiibacteraceae bacterium]